jgi:hypothetical protein
MSYTGISISGAKLYGTTRRVFRGRNETQDLRSYQNVHVDHSISFTRIDDSDIAHGFINKTNVSYCEDYFNKYPEKTKYGSSLFYQIIQSDSGAVNKQHAYIMSADVSKFKLSPFLC